MYLYSGAVNYQLFAIGQAMHLDDRSKACARTSAAYFKVLSERRYILQGTLDPEDHS